MKVQLRFRSERAWGGEVQSQGKVLAEFELPNEQCNPDKLEVFVTQKVLEFAPVQPAAKDEKPKGKGTAGADPERK